jgi:hypothetical protein
MRILIACEFSGTVRDSFIARGHDAWSCDLLPNPHERHIVDDAKIIVQLEWDLIIAHPPCTALCVTGNRHYAGTRAREDAIEFFRLFLDAPCERVAIENPVGVISSAIRPPDQYIQPYEFGHPVTKKTGLWLKGLPRLVPTDVVSPEEGVVFRSGKRMSRWFYETSLLPQKDRASARSVTFKGIAEAMAEQWGSLVESP